jgi:CheY-like chemotaxis protein
MLFGKRERAIRRILIVEDEPLVAFDNEHLLRECGYEVVATDRSRIFALPALLEDLEQRAVLCLLRHRDRLWTLLDVRQLCDRQIELTQDLREASTARQCAPPLDGDREADRDS